MTNPRKQVNATTLRNGKELAEPKKPKEEESSAETEEQTPKGKKYEIPMRHSKGVGEEEKSSTYMAPPAYEPAIPYSQRLKSKKKEETERRYFKLLKVFKKLHINISLLEAL